MSVLIRGGAGDYTRGEKGRQMTVRGDGGQVTVDKNCHSVVRFRIDAKTLAHPERAPGKKEAE